MGDIEIKAGPLEFKAVGDAGQYEGYFSVIGNVDDGGDVIEPGAFAKTLQENAQRVKVFYQHDWSKLIGPAPAVLKEDEHGLFAAGRLTLDSFWGREVWALMKDGALTEGSIGYQAIKFDSDAAGVRHLREIRLHEISPVPLGMNALTTVRAVKAALSGAIAAEEPLETYMATLGLIAGELKAGRVLSAANKDKVEAALSAMKGAMEALEALLAAAEPQKQHSALLLRRMRAAELALAFTREA